MRESGPGSVLSITWLSHVGIHLGLFRGITRPYDWFGNESKPFLNSEVMQPDTEGK